MESFHDNILLFVAYYFRYTFMLKLYHFGTKIGFHHLKADELDESIRKSFDKFCEVYQGIYGYRITFQSSIQIEIISPDTKMMRTITEELRNMLNGFRPSVENTEYAELINLIDNMTNDLSQYLYLLTFN